MPNAFLKIFPPLAILGLVAAGVSGLAVFLSVEAADGLGGLSAHLLCETDREGPVKHS